MSNYARSAFLLVLPFLATAANFPGAVGLVTEASADSLIQPAGSSTPLPTYSGELVFPGDRLISSHGSLIKVAFCPSRELYTVTYGQLAVLIHSVLLDGKAASGAPLNGACELPAITFRTYRDVVVEADKLQLRSSAGDVGKIAKPTVESPAVKTLDAVLRAHPRDLPTLTARAIQWEREGNLGAAAADYGTILNIAPEAAWAGDQMRSALAAEGRASAGNGKTLAVIVGVSAYKYLPFSSQLHYADRDAEYFYDFLTGPRGEARPENVALLVNQDATIAAVREAISKAFAKAGKEDDVILYFAAHGDPVTSGSNSGAYIMAYDSHQEEPSTMYAMADLQKATVDRLRPIHFRVVADVCRAGFIGGTQAGRENLFLTDFLSSRKANTQVLGLLATDKSEDSYECSNLDQGHGAFTYFLLRGLDSDSDAVDERLHEVTIDSLFEYVRGQVRQLTQDKPKHQTPIKNGANYLDDDVLASTKLQSRHLILDSPPPKTCLAPPDGPHSRGLPPHERGGLLDSTEIQAAAEMSAGQEVITRYLLGEQSGVSRQDFERCETSFSNAARLQGGTNPLTEGRLLFCRGRKLVYDNQLNSAVEVLQQAIRRDPLGAYNYNALGIAFLQGAQFQRAVAAFQDAVRLAPAWAYARHNLALAFSEEGRYADATKTYREAIALGTQYAYIPMNLGLLYEKLNRQEEARLAFSEALAASPDMSRAYTGIGVSFALEGRDKKAEQAYQRGLDRAQTTVERLAARHDWALLLVKEKKTDAAIALWRDNLRDDPKDVPTLIGLSEVLYKSGDEAGARPIFLDLLNDNDQHPASRLQYAHVLMSLGSEDEAVKQLRIVLAALPDSSEGGELLGDLLVHRRTRDSDVEAAELYRRALHSATTMGGRARIQKKLSSLDPH